MKLYYLLFLYFLLLFFLIIYLINNQKSRNWKKSNVIEKMRKNLNIIKSISVNSKENYKKLEGFNILVINLPESTTRADSILKEFDNLKLPKPTFLEAINGRKLLLNYSIKNGYINLGKIPSNFGNFEDEVEYINNDEISGPELGCILSHIKAILLAYQNKAEYSLICEDDLSFLLLPFWEFTLKELISRAPSDWDIISIYRDCQNYEQNEFIDYIKNKCFGTVCYIINKKGCEKVLNKLFIDSKLILDKYMSKNKSNTADNLIMDLVNCYTYSKSLVLPINLSQDKESTIHPNHTLSHIQTANKILKIFLQSYFSIE